MKKIFLVLFTLISLKSIGQVYQIMPQYGYDVKRMNFDSTLQIPTVCGVPTIKSVQSLKKAAIAFDSCNNRFYQFNPKTAAWSYLGSGGGGSQDLQSVTDNGNTTSNSIVVSDGTDSVTIAKDGITLFSGTFGGYSSLISGLNHSWSYSSNSTSLAPILNGQHNFYLYNSNTSTQTTDTLATLANIRASGSAIDTTGAFLISVSQPNDSTLTFQKGATQTSYTIRSSVAGSATRLVTSVYNNSGATITKGSVVYINGAHSSNLPTIALAKSNAESTSAYTYGLVENNISNNSSGIVIQSGTITNLNLPTSTYTDGQTLYLSPTTAGGYTLTKPLAPYHYVAIGTITKAHPNFGTIQIAIRNGFQLDEMSDVQIPAVPNDSTLLQFSRVDSLWHSVSVTNAIGSNYIKPTDTASLSSRINLKVNISDTASMLSKYVRKDTACFHLTSDVSTSNTTATNTNLTFPIAANETYRIMIAGTCSKATTTTGMKIAIGAPTGCSIKSVIQGGQALMVTAPQGQLYSSVNTLCTNPFATGAGVEVPFRLEGVITNGANAGSITLQFATVTSNAATIYSGTVMQLIKSKGL